MALSYTIVPNGENVFGRHRSFLYDITFDSSYTSGGFAIAPAKVGLKHILGVQFYGGNAAALGYVPYWDRANAKIVLLHDKAIAAITPTDSKEVLSYSGSAVLGADADVAGSDTTDQAAGPVNDDAIDNFHPTAAAAWTYSEDLEIDFARNVNIAIENTTGGTLSLVDGSTIFTVTGFFRGAAQTDVITFALTGGQEDIVAAKFRWKYGVKPFDKITDVVVTGLDAGSDTIDIGVGLGRLFGIPVTPNTPAESDFTNVIVEGVDVPAATYIYNDANQTLDMGAFTAGEGFTMQYHIDEQVPLSVSAVAAAAFSEPTSVDLSSVTVRAQFIGW